MSTENLPPAVPADLPRPSGAVVALAAAVFVALLAALFVIGWIPHRRAELQAKADAADVFSQAPTVSVEQPRRANAPPDVLLPADVRAFQETAIYPRANGYLHTLAADIGDHVHVGALLALIDTPEVDAQLVQDRAALAQAQTNVAKAQADLDLAQRTLDRYQRVAASGAGAVSAQDVDDKASAVADAQAALAAAKAAVEAEKAAVQGQEVLQGFERVTAPFTGTVTARNYDVGALLNPANESSAKELFHLARTDVLRVYVNLPQPYVGQVRIGQEARLRVRNYPGREFTGVVARSTQALDASTRTLPLELHFDNPDGALYPGMYGEARLPLGAAQPLLVINTSAVVFNAAGLQVALVKDGKVHYQDIKVGRDLGTQMEVTEGLTADDQVVSNPGERLVEGVAVSVAPPSKGAPAAGGTALK